MDYIILLTKHRLRVQNIFDNNDKLSGYIKSKKLFSCIYTLNFSHRASSIFDRRFATPWRTLFVYLINKYIPLSNICVTVHH